MRANHRIRVLLGIISMLSLLKFVGAQESANERVFPQSKLLVDKALAALKPTSGRLPTLEGFVETGDRNLSRFQRGYYECMATVTANSSGSIVKVRAKITAWYQDPTEAKSSYQMLPSNGRLEADLLDRLQDALTGSALNAATSPTTASANRGNSKPSATPQPTLSAPVPQLPAVKSTLNGTAINSQAKSGKPRSSSTSNGSSDQQLQALLAEAKSLDEILRNQSHPTNLVAVKKNGAPVLASPTDGAKVLFTASPEDEFEMLDQNASWVHVRISGLSRGWIRKANLEMPEDFTQSASTPTETFHVTSDQIVPFPGDWEPLRGKTVKLVSVQAPDNAVIGWRAKLDYAKTVFQKDYNALAASGGESGEVVIFDAQDGGMIAATLDNVKKWRDGVLGDDAFWKVCYFDPPETFGAQASQ